MLDDVYALRPERFPSGAPRAAMPPTEVWINPPPTHAFSSKEALYRIRVREKG